MIRIFRKRCAFSCAFALVISVLEHSNGFNRTFIGHNTMKVNNAPWYSTWHLSIVTQRFHRFSFVCIQDGIRIQISKHLRTSLIILNSRQESVYSLFLTLHCSFKMKFVFYSILYFRMQWKYLEKQPGSIPSNKNRWIFTRNNKRNTNKHTHKKWLTNNPRILLLFSGTCDQRRKIKRLDYKVFRFKWNIFWIFPPEWFR